MAKSIFEKDYVAPKPKTTKSTKTKSIFEKDYVAPLPTKSYKATDH